MKARKKNSNDEWKDVVYVQLKDSDILYKFVDKNKVRYARFDKRTINNNGFPSRVVVQRDKKGNIVNEFKSITAAAQANKVLYTSIENNLKGRSKTCGGYIYEYKN